MVQTTIHCNTGVTKKETTAWRDDGGHVGPEDGHLDSASQEKRRFHLRQRAAETFRPVNGNTSAS